MDDNGRAVLDLEIVLIDKESADKVEVENERTKIDILELVHEEFMVDMTTEVPYTPMHSGDFKNNEPVMIESIPSYIKVRKLIKLTEQEKADREILREEHRLEHEAKQLAKENNRKSAENKVKQIGLTKEEFEALFNN